MLLLPSRKLVGYKVIFNLHTFNLKFYKIHSRRKFIFLKFLILQMPISQILIFLILNIIYIEDSEIFDKVILYFVPIIVITVTGGIWGFNIAVKMIAPEYEMFKLRQKYFSFQLVLFFCKLQPTLLNLWLKLVITTCEGPFTVLVKKHSK